MKTKILVVAALIGLLLPVGNTGSLAEESRVVTLVSRVEQGIQIWSPPKISAKKGEEIKIRLENHTEAIHGFTIEGLGVREQIMGYRAIEFTIKPEEKGTFRFVCHFHKAHKGGELKVE